MDKINIIEELKENFQFILADDRILGLFLFGSHAEGSSTPLSDIDLCFIVPNTKIFLPIYNSLMSHAENYRDSYDIRFFEEFPLPLQMEIITKGIPVLAKDVNAVYEYFFYYRRLWEENQFRIKYMIS